LRKHFNDKSLLPDHMKKTLFAFFWLTAFVVFSAKTYGQQNNMLSVIYGTGSDAVFYGSPGAPGFASKGQTLLGLNYIRHIAGAFSIETGVEYSVNNLLWDYEDAYDPNFRPQKTSVKLLSVPVYANFTVWKYVFFNTGLSADFETDQPGVAATDRLVSKQSGISFFLGGGGKYTFNHISLFANPFIQAHKIVSFGPSGGGMLLNSGFRFGVGYGF
jgi:hypothetical protein